MPIGMRAANAPMKEKWDDIDMLAAMRDPLEVNERKQPNMSVKWCPHTVVVFSLQAPLEPRASAFALAGATVDHG